MKPPLTKAGQGRDNDHKELFETLVVVFLFLMALIIFVSILLA